MQVGTLAVQHLFEKDVLYLVPLYQRPYVWNEEDQWQPLWEDFRRIAEAMLAGKQPRAHFLGASVQDRPPVPPGHIETRLLIDGQQRLTTLQLFLKAFDHALVNEEDDRYRRAIEKLVRNNHPLSTQAHEAFKVWPTNADRADFEAVMDAVDRNAVLKHYGKTRDTSAVGRNIPDAYLYFQRAVTAWLSDEGAATRDARIAALYSAVRDNARIVVIDLDEKDDAQLIFETLNARGTPLLAADLVKNSLLNELQNEGGNPEFAYQKYWQHFDADAGFWRAEAGRGHAKRPRIETFLQHALTLLSGEEVATGHLYTAYRDYAKGSSAGPAVARLESFRRYGQIFKAFYTDQPNPRIASFFDRMSTMDIGTVYPFLLALFDVLEGQTEALVATLEHVESFLVRRMVCRLSTRGYNRLFVDLALCLSDGSSEVPDRVRAVLAKGTAEFDRWPDDAEFTKAWAENPLYENLTRPRLRLILEALESAMRNKFSESKDVPKNLTVEHIMPQTWEEHWPLPNMENALAEKTRRNALIHTIGNLTLLNDKLNPVQSNKAWLDTSDPANGKRDALARNSVLHMNKELVDRYPSKWDEGNILERAARLQAYAGDLWRAPPLPSTKDPERA